MPPVKRIGYDPGVTEIAPHELLPFAGADARLDGALSACFLGDYETVLFFAGSVAVREFATVVQARQGAGLIAVAGDLTVGGTIELYDEDDPGLYVGGFTRAETLEAGAPEVYLDRGAVTYLVYGYYNHGILETGEVQTPWVINSDHDLRVTAPGAKVVDNFGRDRTADYTRANIAEHFVAEVVDDEYGSLLVGTFLDRLRAGLPVLRT